MSPQRNKIKTKLKAFIFYVIFSCLIWQFGTSIKNISRNFYLQGQNFSNQIFELTIVHNTGGAFSIFSNHTTALIIFAILTLIVLCVYVYRKISLKDKWAMLSVGLLTGGILGNLVERISYGFVIDYIKLNFIDFAIFNFYDICITLAMITIFFAILTGKYK